MPTSGVTTGLQTVGDIIKDALMTLQVIGPMQSVKPADADFAMRQLNWMLKTWQQDGCNLWRDQEINIPWPADTQEADLAQNYADIQELRLRTNGIDRLLQRWDSSDYNALPNKASPGLPSIYALDQRLGTLRLKLWPVPTATVQLYGTGARVFEDVTSLTQNVDVPQAYTRTVMMNLAATLAPAFGRVTDANSQAVIAEARGLYQLMRAADRPASYYLCPSERYRWQR